MKSIFDAKKYWNAVITQDRVMLKMFFKEDAIINWHSSNESFTVEEFIQVNCDYPGEWIGKIEKYYNFEDLIICVISVKSKDNQFSYHVSSFMEMEEDKIIKLDEYWSTDEKAPQWRQDLHLGRRII